MVAGLKVEGEKLSPVPGMFHGGVKLSRSQYLEVLQEGGGCCCCTGWRAIFVSDSGPPTEVQEQLPRTAGQMAFSGDSGFHREVKSSVQFSVDLAFQRAVERLQEGKKWVARAEESNSGAEDETGEQWLGPRGLCLWVARRMELQCFTSHNNWFSSYLFLLLSPFPQELLYTLVLLLPLYCSSASLTITRPFASPMRVSLLPCSSMFKPYPQLLQSGLSCWTQRAKSDPWAHTWNLDHSAQHSWRKSDSARQN